jgi:hypothetical protein
MIISMKKAIYYNVIFAVILLATSCTKDINIKVNNAVGQLVIEGNLTNVNGPQYVKLSQNVAFTSTNTYPPVSGATVTISDQSGNVYPLTEGPAGTYSVNSLAGVPGNTYTLKVAVNGQTYTANSTMPAEVALDSITAQNNAGIRHVKNGNVSKDIVVWYRDPAAVSNQYRFVMWVNGVQVNELFPFDDRFTNGKYVNNVLRENNIDIYPGDTVTVEMDCIDETMYTYWLTLKQEGGTDARQQTVAPSNPPTNITPATLGYFSAHTAQTATLVVK